MARKYVSIRQHEDKLRQQYIAGSSYRVLAKKYGCSPSAIRNLLTKAGVKMRKGKTAHKAARKLAKPARWVHPGGVVPVAIKFCPNCGCDLHSLINNESASYITNATYEVNVEV